MITVRINGELRNYQNRNVWVVAQNFGLVLLFEFVLFIFHSFFVNKCLTQFRKCVSVCTHCKMEIILQIYSKLNEWKPDLLVSWISDSIHQVSVWASLPGGKSLSLSNYIQPGPALILFTPRNPLYNQVDYYNAVSSYS